MNFRNIIFTAMTAICLFMDCMAQTDIPVLFKAEEFITPPMQYRPIPLWFWNNTAVHSAALAEQLEEMITTDFYGGCAILPFGSGFAPAYMSDDYMSLYGEAIAKAKEYGAAMSLYDEYGFPSGSMGAINGSGVTTFKNNHPEHTIKRLDKTEFGPKAGSTFSRNVNKSGMLMAVVGMEMNTKEIINLRDFMDGQTLTWDVPTEGVWHIMAFNCVVDGDPNVDYLSPEAVSLFVEDTHQQYFNRFADDFGYTIKSTFFDEPTMYRASGRMWTDKFNEEFMARNGYSPELYYPALWYDIGENTAIARNAMFGLRAKLYAEGFMKTIADWAEAHGILSTGHQDQEEVVNTVSVSGDLMLDGKYMSMPGIDKIGGDRPAEHFYKVVSSSANNWDKTYVMSETYGDMGNISLETMYQIAIEQYTKGINNLIPHAVWYDNANVTFLPELSYRNPLYNKGLPAFNRFLARLNYILARPGQHVADVAVVYPIQTMQAGHYLDGPKGNYAGGVDILGVDYNVLSQLLTDELGIDFTYLHPEVIDDRCEVADGKLVMNNPINTERFSTIIIAGSKVMSLSNMQKIEKAWENGVRVIFTSQLPQQSADSNGTDAEIVAIVDRMLETEKDKGEAVFLNSLDAASLAEAFSGQSLDVTFSSNQSFNYIHKVIDGRHVYYFGNIDKQATTNTIMLRKTLEDACWLDPRTGDITSAEIQPTENGCCVELTLVPQQSAFLIERSGIDEIPQLNTDKSGYTITVKAVIDKLSAGICFGTVDENNFYMWQFNAEDVNNPRLRPHRWFGGAVECMAEISMKDKVSIVPGEPFNITIEVTNNNMARTLVDGMEVDVRYGDYPYGKVGIREDHSDALHSIEAAHFDNLLVTNNEGKTLVCDDFEGDCNFSNATIEDGWLYVNGTMSKATYSWFLGDITAISPIPNFLNSDTSRYSEMLEYAKNTHNPSHLKEDYNLMGQTVDRAHLQKGIYIIEGKKIVIR